MTCGRLAFIVLVLTAPPVFAQQPAPEGSLPQAATPPAAEPEYPIIRLGTTTYLQYAAELRNRDGFNAFDITRGYINVLGQLSKNVRFRLTPDVRRITDGSLAGSLTYRIKYGFVQFDNLTPASTIRFGAQPTPWVDFEQSIMRYRVQGTVYAEREGVIPSSGDFGASYQSPVAGQYGEVQVGVFNGEGVSLAEGNQYKSVQGRFTVRPFPGEGVANGLRVSAFLTGGWYAEGRPRHNTILMGSFEHRHLVLTAQMLRARERPSALLTHDIDRTGSSYFVEVRQGTEGWAGLLRVDLFDADESVSANSQHRTIAGAAYWVAWGRGRVGLVATNEQVQYEAATRPDENRVLVQTHIEF